MENFLLCVCRTLHDPRERTRTYYVVLVVVFQANAMNERIGYPEMLTNPDELNAEYDGVCDVTTRT